MNIRIISTLLTFGFIGIAQAGEKTGDLKSSATMQETCSISANQIGFGAVSAPLLAQTAQSEMSVKCSNASAYTINLAYGGIYGTGTASSGYTIAYNGSGANNSTYTVYEGTKILGYFSCGYSGANINKVSFSTTVVSNIYGYNNNVGWQENNGACITNNTLVGTYPVGWKGAFNATGKQEIGSSGYSYGIMNGISKGDKLAYSIAVPGDASKVWNKGNNSYKSTGTGDVQIIPINAKIVPDKSGSKYLAPDLYIDTITAVISY